VIATLLYGCEDWNIIKYDGKSNAAKMILLRSVVGYTLYDHIKINEIRDRVDTYSYKLNEI
jgi:hypothetical protein